MNSTLDEPSKHRGYLIRTCVYVLSRPAGENRFRKRKAYAIRISYLRSCWPQRPDLNYHSLSCMYIYIVFPCRACKQITDLHQLSRDLTCCSLSLLLSYPMAVLLPLSAAFVALGIFLLWQRNTSFLGGIWRRKGLPSTAPLEKSAYMDISPLLEFDWAATEPLRIRPFKPKYHMTMGRWMCFRGFICTYSRTS